MSAVENTFPATRSHRHNVLTKRQFYLVGELYVSGLYGNLFPVPHRTRASDTGSLWTDDDVAIHINVRMEEFLKHKAPNEKKFTVTGANVRAVRESRGYVWVHVPKPPKPALTLVEQTPLERRVHNLAVQVNGNARIDNEWHDKMKARLTKLEADVAYILTQLPTKPAA